MFTSEISEKQENHVNIVDVSHEIFKEMIYYIYNEEVPKLDEYAYELLQAADKYKLDGLKSICEEKLVQIISVDNTVLLLMLADQYQALYLKQEVLKFFKK